MPLNFLKKFAGSKTVIGVDIGTASLKIVEMKSGEGKPIFVNYGYLQSLDYLDRANAAFQTSTLNINEEAIAGHIKSLLKFSGMDTGGAVYASLPAFDSFSTLIEVPSISDKEIAESIGYQARQYIPVPLEESTLDWTKVGERVDVDGNKKTQIFLIAIPNEVIKRYQKIFKLAGLNLVSLEVENVSLARSLTMGANTPTLVMDIGSRSTSFAIAENGFLRFAGQTDFAGGSLTQAVSTALNVAVRRAEDLKRQKGLRSSPGGGPYELFTIIQPLLDVIINEGVRIKNNYEGSYKSKIKSVILSGGGANLIGIENYISKELGIPAVKANPFKNLDYPRTMDPFIGEIGPIMSVAVGLALKDVRS